MNWQTNGGKTVFVWPFSRGLPHSIFGSWSVSIFWMMRNFHSRSFLIVWSGRIAIFPLINGKTSYCISSQTNPTEHFFLLFVVSFFFAASVKKTKLIANTRKKQKDEIGYNITKKSNQTKRNEMSAPLGQTMRKYCCFVFSLNRWLHFFHHLTSLSLASVLTHIPMYHMLFILRSYLQQLGQPFDKKCLWCDFCSISKHTNEKRTPNLNNKIELYERKECESQLSEWAKDLTQNNGERQNIYISSSIHRHSVIHHGFAPNKIWKWIWICTFPPVAIATTPRAATPWLLGHVYLTRTEGFFLARVKLLCWVLSVHFGNNFFLLTDFMPKLVPNNFIAEKWKEISKTPQFLVHSDALRYKDSHENRINNWQREWRKSFFYTRMTF